MRHGRTCDVSRPNDRAAAAERSVSALFGSRLAHLPLTRLARVANPRRGLLDVSWNYWWQAHYLDAVVDAGRRHLRAGDVAAARARAREGSSLLRTVRLRNGGRITNTYYDDMAWLVLASARLGDLFVDLGERVPRRVRAAEDALDARLRSAATDELGGGLYWNIARDFKNVPATGPAAIRFARRGDTERARRLVDWVLASLADERTGLFHDGIRIRGGARTLEASIYSYNQGVLLGALLALGDPASLSRAAELVTAIDAHLTTPGPAGPVLVTHGAGDGGLFTGILARYLALAAADTGLDTRARAVASRLVRDTAAALWEHRDERRARTGSGPEGRVPVLVFPPDPARPAGVLLPPGAPVELSPQLQAWTVLEACSYMAAADGPNGRMAP